MNDLEQIFTSLCLCLGYVLYLHSSVSAVLAGGGDTCLGLAMMAAMEKSVARLHFAVGKIIALSSGIFPRSLVTIMHSRFNSSAQS